MRPPPRRDVYKRQAMREHQHIAFFQVWLDVFFVHCRLLFIVDQDHDDVCLLCRLGCGVHLQSLRLCLSPGLASFVKADDKDVYKRQLYTFPAFSVPLPVLPVWKYCLHRMYFS